MRQPLETLGPSDTRDGAQDADPISARVRGLRG